LAVIPLGVIAVLPLTKFVPAVSPLAKNASQIAGVITLLMPLLAPFIYGVFKAVAWRWWLSGIRFGEVRLESSLLRGALVGLYWKVIGWFLLIVALFVGYLFLCAFLIASINHTPMAKFFTPGNFQGNVPMMVLAAAGYLALILALNIVMRVYLMRDLWARVISSTTVHHIDAAANVFARGDLASALGEGLADGLDVAGF
jgi:hypothetical protein